MWVTVLACPAWAIGPVDLFELSSLLDPFVSSSHPGPFGSSSTSDPFGSSSLLDLFVLLGRSDTSRVSSQPNLSWLSGLLGPFGVE